MWTKASKMILALFTLLTLVALSALFLFLKFRDRLVDARNASIATVNLERSETLRLVGSRGQKITFGIKGYSVRGHWACPGGLALTSENPNFSISFGVKLKDWDDQILYKDTRELKQEFSAHFTVAMPDFLGAETKTPRGTLTGTLLVPLPGSWSRSKSRYDNFVNETIEVNIPVVWDFIPIEKAKQLKADLERPF